jgi:hypothetical protein
MATNKAAKGTMWLWYALMVVSTLVSGVQAQTLPPSAPVEFIPSGSAQGDNVGEVVALSRDYAVIGAPGMELVINPGTGLETRINAGAVYVYRKSSGQWSLMQILQPDGSDDAELAAYDSFGTSVAIYQPDPNSTESTRLIVGAPGSSGSLASYRGAAYVYKLSTSPAPDAWVLEHTFAAPDGTHSESFGCSVAITNEAVVIGDRDDTKNSATSLGRAHVFKYRYFEGIPQWQEEWDYYEQALNPDEFVGINHFGTSVAISQDANVIAVGNPHSAVAPSHGVVYVYEYDIPTESYLIVDKLLPCAEVSPAWRWFGNSVAIDGCWIVVGAPYENNQRGSVYTFQKTGATWSDHACQHLTQYNANQDDRLGWSVDLDGFILIAGAPGNASHLDFLNVYRLGTSTYTDGLWIEQPKMTEYGGSQDSLFGYAVSIDEQIALAGAPDSDDDANAILDTGSFFVINTIVSIDPGCPADIASDGTRFDADEPDGFVGTADFFAVLQAWGTCANPADCPADFIDANGEVGSDGVVGIDEFFFVLQNWGPCGNPDPDSDGDGISDYLESLYPGLSFTNPNDALNDPDHDGISSLLEVTYYGTDPGNADTDGDSINDGIEIIAGADPTDGTDGGVNPGMGSLRYLVIEIGDPSCHNSDLWGVAVDGVPYYNPTALETPCEEPPNMVQNCTAPWDCESEGRGVVFLEPIEINSDTGHTILPIWGGTSYLTYGPDYDYSCYVYLSNESGSVRIPLNPGSSQLGVTLVDEHDVLGHHVQSPDNPPPPTVEEQALIVPHIVDLKVDANNDGAINDDDQVLVDSNKDGEINHQDSEIEALTPGHLILINDDDDNANDVADYDDTDTIDDEDDISSMTLRIETEANEDYQWRLTYPDTRIRVWTSLERSEQVASGTDHDLPTPETLYIEALQTSEASGDVEITLSTVKKSNGDVHITDTVKITVIGMWFVGPHFQPVPAGQDENAIIPPTEALNISNFISDQFLETDESPEGYLKAPVDPDNFRLQVQNASSNTTSGVRTRIDIIRDGEVESGNSGTVYADHQIPNGIVPGNKVWRSDVLRLVVDGDATDRGAKRFQVYLGDKVRLQYEPRYKINETGSVIDGRALYRSIPVGLPAADGGGNNDLPNQRRHDIKTLRVRFHVYDKTNGSPCVSVSRVQDDLEYLQQRMAQATIAVEQVGDINYIELPENDSLDNGLLVSSSTIFTAYSVSELAIIENNIVDNVVDIFYIYGITFEGGEPAAVSYPRFANQTSPLVAGGHNFTVINGRDNRPFTLAHEVMHILLNDNHRDNETPPGEGQDEQSALFRAPTSSSNTVMGTKRIGPYRYIDDDVAEDALGATDTTIIRSHVETLW